jgi:hypothetical protein
MLFAMGGWILIKTEKEKKSAFFWGVIRFVHVRAVERQIIRYQDYYTEYNRDQKKLERRQYLLLTFSIRALFELEY